MRRLKRETRDNYRKIGGKFYIDDTCVKIALGNVLIAVVTIVDGYTDRVHDICNAVIATRQAFDLLPKNEYVKL